MNKPILFGFATLLLATTIATTEVLPILKTLPKNNSINRFNKGMDDKKNSIHSSPHHLKNEHKRYHREHKKQLNQLRTEMISILQQGDKASPEDALVLLKKLTSLSESNTSTAHLQSLEKILQHTIELQKLNSNLQKNQNSHAEQDVAKNKLILIEIKTISEQIRKEAEKLKTQATSDLSYKTPP